MAVIVLLFSKLVGKNHVLLSKLIEKTETRINSDHRVNLNANNINSVVNELFIKA